MTSTNAKDGAPTALNLKPCPFCGGPATLGGMPSGVIGQVSCRNDDCFGPKTTALSKADSIVQWNTRAASQPDREALARIKANASQLVRSYYEASGGHMVDGPTATAEIACKHFEADCDAILSLLSDGVKCTRGGPTESDPDRPYCKADQSCCDFVCGN